MGRFISTGLINSYFNGDAARFFSLPAKGKTGFD
jgi:hypothetical protein